MRQATYDRLALICHLFGGVTPMNIGEMAYVDFRILAAEADAYEAEQKKQTKK